MDMIVPDEIFQAVRKFIKSGRAVFFDRDGTLCRDAHYLSRMDDFETLPGLGKLMELKKAGYVLIGVTNQSGIARGLVAEDFVRQVNSIFINSCGFDAFYYCPHHPDEGCSCRKPEPALLFQARRDFDVDLKKSFVVGDREPDMLLAKSVGAKGILVRTGKEAFAPSSDWVAEDLEQVVEIILRQ